MQASIYLFKVAEGEMAGKRQHYVPQLLQRGFLASSNDGAERTWLHRSGKDAKLVGIRDIGVEDWFYSRRSTDGSPTLDDAITEYEGDLAENVNMLRGSSPGREVAPRIAADIVVHLVLRTAHLRSLLETGLSRITNEIEMLFTDRTRLSAMFGLSSPVIAEATRNAIRSSAADLAPAGIPSDFAERLITFMMREFGDQLVAQAALSLGPLISGAFGDVARKVRDAHNQMLVRTREENGWIAALKLFQWTIEEGENLILPDAVALSRSGEAPLAPLLLTSGDDTTLVVMPVASDRILVGRRDGAQFEAEHFNDAAATACASFFVAARPRDHEGLVERIGTGPAEALETTIAEAIKEAEQARRLSEHDIAPALPEQRETKEFSYSMRLADFGDAIHAKELADVVQAVIVELARELPLHDLDGLTIAVDYANALATLDRGDVNLPAIGSGALSYGVGVAKPVTVWRDGVRKEHLVVAAGVAESWISPDAATRAFGLHTLVKMLAGIAHTTRYSGALQTAFKPDPMASRLHLAVAATPSGYWGAQQAAYISPDEGGTYAELVLESLRHADELIAAERPKMADPSDVGAISLCALECVSAVLGHAADWLGHREGLPEGQAFEGSDLPAQLKSRGLDRWIELFGRDLAACYSPEGALEIAFVTTLSRHVERLFWSLGLFCWPDGDNVRCIVGDQPFIPGDFI